MKILDLEDKRYVIVYKRKEYKDIDTCLFCDFSKEINKGFIKCRLEEILGTIWLVNRSFCYEEDGSYFKLLNKER